MKQLTNINKIPSQYQGNDPLILKNNLKIYVYIYIYVCVCVCVCIMVKDKLYYNLYKDIYNRIF